MINVTIETNDADQRLDRFLKKYLPKASLSQIYKIIRKNLKVNGKRGKENQKLNDGDLLTFFLAEEEFNAFKSEKKSIHVRKNFKVVYEDDDILVASKPFGLLTHGDGKEKKNHLANQVINYLIEKGDYIPSKEQTFSPSPVNRLDRNTTGLVIFGKNAKTLKELNQKMKSREHIEKYYLTIVRGKMDKEMELKGSLVKDKDKNQVIVFEDKKAPDSKDEKLIETTAKPVAYAKGYTLVEVELVTGRTHQIRAHLSSNGFHIIGDSKYGDFRTNQQIKRKFSLSTQFLHAYKLIIDDKTIVDTLPDNLMKIAVDIFGKDTIEDVLR